MFAGRRKTLEIGCADAFGTRLVRQVVPEVVAVDIDPIFISDCVSRDSVNNPWPVTYQVHDILKAHVPESFDSIFALDVFEHIPEKYERVFISNIMRSMDVGSMLIIGCPSLESQIYASVGSRIGHVNCKNGDDLKKLYLEYFRSVLLFSMNDEVVHTGYSKMAHYNFVVCTEKRCE